MLRVYNPNLFAVAPAHKMPHHTQIYLQDILSPALRQEVCLCGLVRELNNALQAAFAAGCRHQKALDNLLSDSKHGV